MVHSLLNGTVIMKLYEPEKMAVYLDVCALCRSFDDQQYMRIRLETAAVELIMERIKIGDYQLYYSPVHYLEIGAFEDLYERGELLDFLICWGVNAEKHVVLRDARHRADELVRKGYSSGDAAHVAFAQAVNAAFITCDDKLIKKCRRYDDGIWCGTPVEFCEKEKLK